MLPTEPRFYGLSKEEPTPEKLAEIERLSNQIKGMNEDRHHPFFALAVKMRSAGFFLSEIECRLMGIAGNDNKMRGKARDIIKSLKGYR